MPPFSEQDIKMVSYDPIKVNALKMPIFPWGYPYFFGEERGEIMAVAEAQLIGDLRDAHGSILQQLFCNACFPFQKIVVGRDAILRFESTDQMGFCIKEIFDHCVEGHGKVGHSVQPVL